MMAAMTKMQKHPTPFPSIPVFKGADGAGPLPFPGVGEQGVAEDGHPVLLLLRLVLVLLARAPDGPTLPLVRAMAWICGRPSIHQKGLVQRVLPVRVAPPLPLPRAAGVDAAVAEAVAAAGARGTQAVAPLIHTAVLHPCM